MPGSPSFFYHKVPTTLADRSLPSRKETGSLYSGEFNQTKTFIWRMGPPPKKVHPDNPENNPFSQVQGS